MAKSNRQDRRPSFQFYPGDWLSCPELRRCSVEARGLWIDMLALMWMAPRRGYLETGEQAKPAEIGSKELAKIVGEDIKSVSRILYELKEAGVYGIDSNGTIFSRRMVAEWDLSRIRAEAGRKGGMKSKAKAKPKHFAEEEVEEEDLINDTKTNPNDLSLNKSPSSTSCAAPLQDATPPSDAVLVFPVSGKDKEWWLTGEKINEYHRLFGTQVDVITECKKAKQWCVDNPTKRKTYRGMPAFLNRWISKAVDNGTGSPPKTIKELRAEAARMRKAAQADREQNRRHNRPKVLETDPASVGSILENMKPKQ